MRLIETDAFPSEFLSRLAERESWRKEIHRPIYHVHKWWAKRLGSVFRGILLGTRLPETGDLAAEFNEVHRFADETVFDPFMGSGTTIGEIEETWPAGGRVPERAVYLSCGDSADTGLPDRSIGLVVTDPPFFDNVHYSELADFFHAWQQPAPDSGDVAGSTRRPAEVQDPDASRFAAKLRGVFRECRRILEDDGLLVFTYHHSRDEGWKALAAAVLGAGFAVVNSQPVKAEMSVATPKSQAKEPIQLDIIVVCRKAGGLDRPRPTVAQALELARVKLGRLRTAGFELSRNDRKIVVLGQLLTTLETPAELDAIRHHAEAMIEDVERGQLLLFD